ncbi:MAG: CsbD family protein [Acidobacteriota bacterium]
MNNDGTVKEELGGFKDRVVGDVKDATGAVTGDRSLQREGEAQNAMGNARQENNDVLGSNTGAARSTSNSGMVTGMFRTREDAERAYNSVTGRGYGKDDVNLLMSDKTRETHFADGADTELGSKAMEGAGVGSAIGGTLGAVIAGIAAIGTSVLIPGLGLLVAGPLAAALAGAGAGGLTGGLVGALVGSGIPEETAKQYESGINDGGIVVGVQPRNAADADYFQNEWNTYNGEHIYR